MNSYKTLADTELIKLLKLDNQHAFSELYNRYKGVLHLHAYKKLGDLEAAKDLIQELFIHLWNKRNTLADVKNPSGYLHIMLRNRILDVIAHNKVESKYINSLQTFIGDANYTTDRQIREKEFGLFIEKIINELPLKMREVFIMSRNTGKSHKQIAEELGITESTVKNHVKGALKILRSKLGLLNFISFLFF